MDLLLLHRVGLLYAALLFEMTWYGIGFVLLLLFGWSEVGSLYVFRVGTRRTLSGRICYIGGQLRTGFDSTLRSWGTVLLASWLGCRLWSNFILVLFVLGFVLGLNMLLGSKWARVSYSGDLKSSL